MSKFKKLIQPLFLFNLPFMRLCIPPSPLRGTPPKIIFENFKGRILYAIGYQAVPLFFVEKEGDEVHRTGGGNNEAVY